MGRAAIEKLFKPDGRLGLECFSAGALRSLRAALDAAHRTGWPSVRSPHLFIGLLEEADEPVTRWLEQNQLQASQLRQLFLELFDMSEKLPLPQLSLQRQHFSEHLIEILCSAYQRAVNRNVSAIAPADLLAAVLLSEPSVVAECLRREGYNVPNLLRSVNSI